MLLWFLCYTCTRWVEYRPPGRPLCDVIQLYRSNYGVLNMLKNDELNFQSWSDVCLACPYIDRLYEGMLAYLLLHALVLSHVTHLTGVGNNSAA